VALWSKGTIAHLKSARPILAFEMICDHSAGRESRREGPSRRAPLFDHLNARQRNGVERRPPGLSFVCVNDLGVGPTMTKEIIQMRKEQAKRHHRRALVSLSEFWGQRPAISASSIELRRARHAADNIRLHAPRRGCADIKALHDDFREAFPDLNFCGNGRHGSPRATMWLGRWKAAAPTRVTLAFSDF